MAVTVCNFYFAATFTVTYHIYIGNYSREFLWETLFLNCVFLKFCLRSRVCIFIEYLINGRGMWT